MVLPSSHEVPRVSWYSGFRPGFLALRLRVCHPLRRRLSRRLRLCSYSLAPVRTPVIPKDHRFGLLRVRSPLLAESLLFSLPGATKMFQFAPCPPAALFYSRVGAQVLTPGGFPHSEICGSTDICSFPQLIAACRVLLRLLMPRHSPCALHSLTLLFEAEFFTDKI